MKRASIKVPVQVFRALVAVFRMGKAVLTKSALVLATLIVMFTAACGGGSQRAGKVSLTMLPLTTTVPQSGVRQFSVSVSGTSNTRVTFLVVEGVTGGTVTTSGAYTAPNVPGTYHLSATSQADPTVVSTATITVPVVAISVSPSASMVNPLHTRQFSADVEGTVNNVVLWTLQEGSTAGTISDGLYTAPTTLGTFHLIATSAADPGKSAVASIIVTDTLGSFTPVQSMIQVSGVHTATLLPNGQALVAGGCGGEDYLEVGQPDAELYDPATQVFTTTGSMQQPRCRHTATLLPNGKVLASGGFGDAFDGPATPSSSAELYDPATRSFSPLTMSQARAAHTATLLANGKVLIIGGGDIGGWGFPFYGSATSTADIYDPATNMFTATGTMGTPRFGHTATLLASGKVLVTGGFTVATVNQQASSLQSAEIYDPVTEIFSPVASGMSTGRAGHTATLLQDGRVLVTGGFMTVGSTTAVASSADLYDPSTGVFTFAGNMTASREEHTASLLMNGQVLIAGGAANEVLATTELYDPATGTFTGTESMTTPRAGHSATVLQDGTVLISGGEGSLSFIPLYLRSAEIFTPPH